MVRIGLDWEVYFFQMQNDHFTGNPIPMVKLGYESTDRVRMFDGHRS
jgi:hypothetical protein